MTELAVLRCVGVVATTGQRCGKPAKPGTRRCGFHTTVPPERQRCQHQFPDGQRCEGRIHVDRVGVGQVCQQHRRVCVAEGCGSRHDRLDGLCWRCEREAAREAAPPKLEGASRRERWEATFGHLPRCTEMSAETDQPCSREAAPGQTRCHKHATLPDDCDRCVHAYANGKRCPRRAVTVKTQRCTHHRVEVKKGRPLSGSEPVFRPCGVCGTPSKGVLGCAQHAPQCSGTTGRGVSCSRAATTEVDGVAYCRTHVARPVTPAPTPDKGPAVACGIPSGEHGRPCAAPAVLGTSRCHKHATLPADGDRCAHLYESGERCPSRSRHAHGHGYNPNCAVHSTPMLSRPRCAATVPDGSQCRHDSLPDVPYCAFHRETPTQRRCAWIHANGERCRSAISASSVDGAVWRDLCPRHHVPCGYSGCETTTGFGDGLCVTHRPRCAWDGCRKPAMAGDMCVRHQQMDSHGTCSLLTFDGQPCKNPATKDGGVDGVVCAHHHTTLPPDEERCRHTHETGERCALSGQRGTLYCGIHQSSHSTGCTWTTSTGDRCGKPTTARQGESRPTCERHRQVPPDLERCLHIHETGDRCAASVKRDTLYCQAHATTYVEQCSIRLADGRQCDRLAHLRAGEQQPLCGSHRHLPEGDDRCVEVLEGGQQCPAVRLLGSDGCVLHATRDTCPEVTPSGAPCGNSFVVRLGEPQRCHEHRDLPADRERCRAEFEDGKRCPAHRNRRRDYCATHHDQQQRCAAVDDRDVRCRRYAPTGETLCDAHSLWSPGQSPDRPDEFEMFFLRPRMSLIWELAEAEARSAAHDTSVQALSADRSTIVPGNVGTQEKGEKTGVKELDELTQVDPFDITGARRGYNELVADGATKEEALVAARLLSKRYSPNTVRSLTARLRPYLEWCQDNAVASIPASRTTIMRFLTHLTQRGRVWDGEPLSSTSMSSFQQAIAQAHTTLGLPNPFEEHPELRHLLKGYNRVHSKPQIQAHAIRIDELAALIGAASQGPPTNLRDTVIATVVADPEVGMSAKETERWTWENIEFTPKEDTRVTIWKGSDKRPIRNDLLIPNRSTAADPSDHNISTGIPLEVIMCGTASLQALASERISQGLPLSGPVLTKDDGTPMTRQAVLKALNSSAQKAGLEYSPTYTFDDRVRLVEAITAPSLMGLRDAAVMAVSWWASLRRVEVSNLNVGDIGKDSRGRGLVVLVRKSKTDLDGQFVPVPYAKDNQGRLIATDCSRALHAWMSAYSQHLGRELAEDDPLFISTHNARGERLGEKGVADVIHRYAERAGIHAELGERISSHGFRAGYATEWLATGRPSEPLAKRQRRASTQSLLGYFRLADPFEDSLAFTFNAPDEFQFEVQKLEAQIRGEDKKRGKETQ